MSNYSEQEVLSLLALMPSINKATSQSEDSEIVRAGYGGKNLFKLMANPYDMKKYGGSQQQQTLTYPTK
jgi:hypothetical protein